MEDSIEFFLDAIITCFVLAACLPVFLFTTQALMYGTSFGFNTLNEKSVIATDAQLRDLNLDTYLDEKLLWSLSHVAMLESVDNVIRDENRVVTALGYSYDYSLDDASKLDKKTQILSGTNFVYGMSASGTNFSTKQFQINVDINGDLTFSPRREVIE